MTASAASRWRSTARTRSRRTASRASWRVFSRAPAASDRVSRRRLASRGSFGGAAGSALPPAVGSSLERVTRSWARASRPASARDRIDTADRARTGTR
ncbi:MAG: hypothetical protein HY721_31200 [Planctomycetes bacterium]|nr:hypothetical protein [Planctomycetota bacterium]